MFCNLYEHIGKWRSPKRKPPLFLCASIIQREGDCELHSWFLVLSWASEETCRPKKWFSAVQVKPESGPAPIVSICQQVCLHDILTVELEQKRWCWSDPASAEVIRLSTALPVKPWYWSSVLTNCTVASYAERLFRTVKTSLRSVPGANPSVSTFPLIFST